MVLIDKAEPFPSRISLLASCLNCMDLDDVYLIPAIRAVLESHKESAVKNTREEDIKKESPPTPKQKFT